MTKRVRFTSLLLSISAISLAQPVKMTEYAIPTANSGPWYITPGPDGALWFTESNANKIGRITTAGAITEYTIPTNCSNPAGITEGPDGALWFTESGEAGAGCGNKIGRISTGGHVTEFAVPTSSSWPLGIAAGPDGALWFTESSPYSGNKIGRITTSGTVTEFDAPSPASQPTNIVRGPDGALWFTERDSATNKIGRLTTDGVISEFQVPCGFCNPLGIAVGSDGTMWFTEDTGNSVDQITTAGVIKRHQLVSDEIEVLAGVATGPDGALWFTIFDYYSQPGFETSGHPEADRIGRITTSGIISEYPIPTPTGDPSEIALGPDGALWFTEWDGNKIGKISFADPSSLSIYLDGVVNAASYSAPIAPGSIATVFGNFLLTSPLVDTNSPLLTSLSGISLQFGTGFLAPLFFVSGAQVNFQVPWELTGETATLAVALNEHTSAVQTVTLVPAAPAIFTMNAAGTGQGAIQDSFFNLVTRSNPVTAGATISIYCTGLGPVTNQPPTGTAAPSAPLAETIIKPTVTIGGVPAQVSFSGLAPGAVGEYQVNVLVPANTPKGNAVQVVLSIGGVNSNTATIAVR